MAEASGAITIRTEVIVDNVRGIQKKVRLDDKNINMLLVLFG